MEYGLFIRKMRIERGLSQRVLAAYSKISPAYMSAIENGKAKNLSEEVVTNIEKSLELKNEERIIYQDLASSIIKNRVSDDIYRYVSDNECVRIAIRKAMAKSLSSKEWNIIIHQIENM